MKTLHDTSLQSAVVANDNDLELHFRPVTLDDIGTITAFIQREKSRSCDYSIGGIYMWIDFFNYEFCVVRDTLFIKGLSEDESRRPSFAVPIGAMPPEESVELVRRYCEANNQPVLFSAVPDDKLEAITALGAKEITPLDDWADYIYASEDLATLTGKRYNKKRNHVNRFMAENPGYTLDALEGETLEQTRDFFSRLEADSDSLMAEYERAQCADVLRNFNRYPFEGAALRDNNGEIVAFTVGEIVGDTLILHIEKMRHDVAGAGETINKLFAARMLRHYPGIKFINREDDAGDPGLRYAKLSYHPHHLITKSNVLF